MESVELFRRFFLRDFFRKGDLTETGQRIRDNTDLFDIEFYAEEEQGHLSCVDFGQVTCERNELTERAASESSATSKSTKSPKKPKKRENNAGRKRNRNRDDGDDESELCERNLKKKAKSSSSSEDPSSRDC